MFEPTLVLQGGGATTSRFPPRVVLGASCFALIVVMSSVTAINLGLKGIALDLHASSSDLTWVADAYTVTLAALVLPFGALGDDFGRRRTLLVGTVVLGASAGVAAICGSVDLVIVCRAGMGLGAAMVMPATLSTVTSVYGTDEHERAVGIWAGFASAGAVVGLLMAGALLDVFSWRAIFVGTAVLAVVSLFVTAAVVPDTRGGERPAPDPVGAVLSGVAIAAFVYAIIGGAENGYGRTGPLAGFLATAAAVPLFIVWELRRERPMLDPRNFRRAGFGPGAVVLTIQFFGTFGFFYVGLQYVQLILGFSPLRSAFAFLPMALVVLPLSALAPRLADRVGAKIVVAAGLSCMVAGFLLMTGLHASSLYPHFLLALLVFSGGLALAATPATNAVVNALPPDKQGVASAVNDLTRELGSAVGIALLGSLLASAYRGHLRGLPAQLPVAAGSAIRDSAAAGLQVAADPRLGRSGQTIRMIVRDAFLTGMDHAFIAGAIVATAGLVYAVLRLPGRRPR